MTKLQRLSALAWLGAATLPLISAQPSAAVSISVGGNPYEIFAVKEKPADYLGDFKTFADSGKMPWWGDIMAASKFAKEVWTALGEGSVMGHGPLFAYEFSGSDVHGLIQDLNVPASQDMSNTLTTDPVIYAYAADPSTFKKDPPPVPMPLPVFGTAAAYGWSRRLRRRLRKQMHG